MSDLPERLNFSQFLNFLKESVFIYSCLTSLFNDFCKEFTVSLFEGKSISSVLTGYCSMN